VIHYEIVPGDKLEVHVAAKGGGSEAKTKFAMLNPSDAVVDWVLKMVPTMGADWCPPGMLGIGIGANVKQVNLDTVTREEIASWKPGDSLLLNGKKKGTGNAKAGNKYLSWAYSEAAHFAVRFEPLAQRFYERKKAKTNGIIAIRAVARKLARATWMMLRHQVPYDARLMFPN
jgi:hypothetical protein